MSLSSVLQTAASGISAAEFSLGVIANNLANCLTPGFKASRVALATQMPQTRSSGAAPTAHDGGRNPVQVGTGVFAAEVSTDFSQGSIALDSSPTSLAIQGEGFFILEGSGGERLYTRDGRFSINAEGELVSAGGHRVLGLGGDVARDPGEIGLARFANPSGLLSQGQNVYAPGPNSGLPVASRPGEAGAGEIVPGAVELSNADVGDCLVDLMLTSTQFRANLQVLGTADRLLDELMSLGRAR
jgi:flagellar hook protein FlgE